MDLNSTDVHRQSQKLLHSTTTVNVNTDGIIQAGTIDTTTVNATKQLNDRSKEISASKSIESLPKVLYLKKVQHPVQQQKTTSVIKEPIPKLIVSTKSIKLASQIITPDGVRYITTARKPTTLEHNDQSAIKQADAIKSTKIIIKGITSQDKRLVVCESPTTTDPLGSPQLSPTIQSPKIVIESNKIESKETLNDEPSTLEIDEHINTPEPVSSILDTNEENRSNSNTPRANREMKQLQKTMKESKVLTDYIALVDETRRIKRKLNEAEESEETAAIALDASQTNMVRSRSVSVTKESIEVGSISIRRNTRSLNAEFSAKQRKFLAGIQKHSRDSDEDHSDDERGRGRRKIRKSGKLFPPLKVCDDFVMCKRRLLLGRGRSLKISHFTSTFLKFRIVNVVLTIYISWSLSSTMYELNFQKTFMCPKLQ